MPIVVASSPIFDSMVDYFMPIAANDSSTIIAGSSSFDSMIDQFLSAPASSHFFDDSKVDQFLPTSTVDSSTTTTGSFMTKTRSFQDTMKALLNYNLEACNNLEELSKSSMVI
ncbi:hypothetical protein L3X38_025139 [Prunus dulcis]|uniref:Uncharacterized protein n=1 Tax=Prunus dulcis TaxID=3755 RepID=A0AAD4W1X9_PRUDU|nr:hypothetical protein L3X38_025139 [Prunus dulcis]